jgi:TRAP-type transport system periplasmic protein
VILMNKGVWDKLSPDIQKVLEEIAAETERRHAAYMQASLKKEDEKLKKLGIEFIKFSPADAERYVRTAYDAGWKDFAEKNAATIKANPGLLEKLQQLGR